MAITPDDLKATLASQGGAGARTAAELDNGRLTANLAEAEAEVRGRLAGYVIPAQEPDLVRTIVLGIAAYLATLEYYGSQQLEQRDPVVLRYERAKELLGMLAGGKITLEDMPPKGDGGHAGGDPAAYSNTPDVGLADGWLDDSATAGRTTPMYHGGMTWG